MPTWCLSSLLASLRARRNCVSTVTQLVQAISFATCGIGKLFKLGKEVAKGVTKKGVTKLVGKMVAEGGYHAGIIRDIG